VHLGVSEHDERVQDLIFNPPELSSKSFHRTKQKTKQDCVIWVLIIAEDPHSRVQERARVIAL